MEEKIMLVPLIKMGARVKIKPGTRFYQGNSIYNPINVSGKICPGDSAWLTVRWDNGQKNNYEEEDLIFEEPNDMAEVDVHKIYFEDNELVISNMEELLWALYPYDKGGNAVATFYHAVLTGESIQQCQANKMRSFDDILFLANTYLPGISVKDVFIGLLLFNVESKDIKKGHLRKSFSNCSTIKRIRFTNSYHNIGNVLYSIDCNKYDSIYSWRDLFNMIGVRNDEDLKNWYIEQLKVEV